MSIKYKLLCILLLIGAGAVRITGFFGYEMGKRGLTQTAMNQLTGIRRSKAYQIELTSETFEAKFSHFEGKPDGKGRIR